MVDSIPTVNSIYIVDHITLTLRAICHSLRRRSIEPNPLALLATQESEFYSIFPRAKFSSETQKTGNFFMRQSFFSGGLASCSSGVVAAVADCRRLAAASLAGTDGNFANLGGCGFGWQETREIARAGSTTARAARRVSWKRACIWKRSRINRESIRRILL